MANVVAKNAFINVSKNGFGWYKVQYKDVAREGKVIEANIRPKMWKDIQSEVDSGKKFKTYEGVFYKHWRMETNAGRFYSARRQVEGIGKVAYERGDAKLMNEVAEVLGKGDEAVYRWYQMWLSEHTDEEIEEFYDYDTVDASGLTKRMLEYEF